MLSVWLPSWPTQRLIRAGCFAPTAELATVESVRGARRLAAISPRAAERGLRPEQSLSEARAICPELAVMNADPEEDQAALVRLAAWCERYTPLAAADPPDGLWLDIAGCAHLFGSEAALAADLCTRMHCQGLTCRLALADTPGAAWALARSATARDDCTIVPPGEEARAIGVLPVALLRLDPRTVAGLRRVGLRSIGEMARLPRGELASHYGAATLLRLDQAQGRAPEAIVWPHPLAPWEERLPFAEPIGTPEDLVRALDALARRLCVRLEAAGRGGRHFLARFLRVDDVRPEIAIATALPVRGPAYITKLLTAKLDTVDPGFGVDAITLAATATAPLAPPQGRLGDLAAPQETALAATVDELANRLGERRVWRPAPAGSHIPERAVRRVPALTKQPDWPDDPSRERPARLFRRPVPIDVIAPVPDDPPILFRWRGTTHRVRAADGPERIAAEWWRRRGMTGDGEEDPVRDYYRVEDLDGARFWIYRAGLMGGARTPRWYLHGLFG
jgi:protein ImuB